MIGWPEIPNGGVFGEDKQEDDDDGGGGLWLDGEGNFRDWRILVMYQIYII